MPTFRHATTNEVREIDQSVVDAWIASGNPKATVWQAYTPPPPEPYVPPPVTELTRRQFFKSVHIKLGLTRAQIRSYLTDEQDLIDFDEASVVRRDFPLLPVLAAAVGIAPADIEAKLDEVFTFGATFE